MATLSTGTATRSCLCSAPQIQSLARPKSPSKTRIPQTTNKPKPSPLENRHLKPHKCKYKPPPQPVSGGEATTYTRLPPIEDFTSAASSSSSSSSSSSFSVVKLSDSGVPKKQLHNDDKKKKKKINTRPSPSGSEEEEDGTDGNFIEDYGSFEMLEVGSDFEDDEDYDYGSEEGEMLDGNEVNNYNEEEEVKEKEKGVPSVMRCFDRAKIYVKAGDGGNGVVAFRREKFVPFGGPSGGDGGKGGNVYLEVEGSMNSLLPFRNKVHFRAGRGSHGQGMLMDGARGDDVVVKVAPGTVVREAGKEEVLLELLWPGQRALVLPGGKGGRGNAAFKSGSNKVPRIAENGEEGPEMWLELELKLVADVGIVGVPNAGKSTLLSVISAAQPAIANYPFTTLLPNLGVVSFDYDSTMVVADLPGLLEGAHRGLGLGHEFLRHTERCSALVHVVDGSSQQPELEFDAVRLELELFSPELAQKPYVVAYNKMDLPDAYENWPSFKKRLQAHGIEPFCMSAVNRDGTHEVICAAYELLQKSKQVDEEFEGWTNPVELNHVADMVQQQRRAPINDFEIFYDSGSNTWHVDGSGLQRFVQMTNWRYADSERRFQHVLEACGVNKSLMKMGVKEGDTVIVGEMEMVWHDSPEGSGPSNMKKGSMDSTKWPEWK